MPLSVLLPILLVCQLGADSPEQRGSSDRIGPRFCEGDIELTRWTGMTTRHPVQIQADNFSFLSFSEAMHVVCDYEVENIHPDPHQPDLVSVIIWCQPLGTPGHDEIIVTAHTEDGGTDSVVLRIESYQVDDWRTLERSLGTATWVLPEDGDVLWEMDENFWEVVTTAAGGLNRDTQAGLVQWYHMPYETYQQGSPRFRRNLDHWIPGIPGLGDYATFPQIQFTQPNQPPIYWSHEIDNED